jgi:AcrR family transcriptional regulator
LATADTKTRILDAAEKRFASEGYAATSLRAITSEAGVNLAAVNYHFGGKEALFHDVFARRIGPINEHRLSKLDELEAEIPSGPLPLERVLEIFLRPALELARTGHGSRFMRLVGRMHLETELMTRVMEREFQEVKRRFLAALHRALPELPQAELLWRGHFMVGAMLHTMNDCHQIKQMSNGLCDPSDTEGTLRRLVHFVAAGMRASVDGRARPRANDAERTRGGRRPAWRRSTDGHSLLR